jgi:hypothetical protein
MKKLLYYLLAYTITTIVLLLALWLIGFICFTIGI